MLGNNITNYVFPMGDMLAATLPRTGDARAPMRAMRFANPLRAVTTCFSSARSGSRDAMHMNSVGLGNPVKRTCATCHGMHMTGMDTANGWMDIGTTNLPWADGETREPMGHSRQPEMPLFKLTCHSRMRRIRSSGA